MRAMLVLLTLLTVLSQQTRWSSAAETLSFDEIRAGYLKNQAKFKSARITYRHQTDSRNAETETFKFQVSDIDLWTDGQRLQFRTPRPSNPEAPDLTAAPAPFVFPDTPITPAALLTDYRRIAIWSHAGDPDVMDRQWHGISDTHRAIAGWVGNGSTPFEIFGLKTNSLSLPPLGNAPAVNLRTSIHPYDEFFQETLAERRAKNTEPGEITEKVVGREHLNGHETILMERCFPLGSSIEKHHPAAVGRLQMVAVDKVWIDPARGFLPLRFERWFKPRLDGVVLTRPGDFALFVFETEEIIRPGTDAYYPGKVALQQLVAVRQRGEISEEPEPNWIAELLTTGKLLPNPEKPQLWQKTTWHVSRVTIAPSMPAEMFALQFPRGAVYHDERYRGPVVNGRPSDPLWVYYINNWLTALSVVSQPLLPFLDHLE